MRWFRFTFMAVAVISTSVVTHAGSSDTAREARLKTLGQALEDYAFDHEGKLPQSLSELYYMSYVKELALLLPVGSSPEQPDRTMVDQVSGYEVTAQTLDPQSEEPILQEKRVSGGSPPLVLHGNGVVSPKGQRPEKREPAPAVSKTPEVPVTTPAPEGSDRLGADIVTYTPDEARTLGLMHVPGVLVLNVRPGTPAERASLQEGDVIIWLAGNSVSRAEQVTSLVDELPSGAVLTMLVRRGREMLPTDLQLGPAGEPSGSPQTKTPPAAAVDMRLGIAVQDLTAAERERLGIVDMPAVRISEVGEGLAKRHGVRVGDLLLALDADDVSSAAGFQTLVENADFSDGIELVLLREEDIIVLEIPSAPAR